MQPMNQTLHMSKQYSDFTLLPFNRKKISQAHIESLVEAISKKNMMATHPILCNENLEIIDGQHRFMALCKLQLPIVYIIEEGASVDELFAVNTNLSWNLEDFHNFYVHRGFKEYVKLNEYMLKNNLSLSFVLNTMSFFQAVSRKDFKNGKYVHNVELTGIDFDLIRETIALVERLKGQQLWMRSTKFMAALSYLTAIPGFDKRHWLNQVPVLHDMFAKRFGRGEYVRMLIKIYNFNKKKDRLECEEVE